MEASASRKKTSNQSKLLMLVLYIAIALAMLLVSVLALHLPLVSVGAFVILETLLAALLKSTPVFVHGGVLLLEIVFGIITGKWLFVLLMAVVYVAALLVLSVFLAGEK